jgi:hypothetical protein
MTAQRSMTDQQMLTKYGYDEAGDWPPVNPILSEFRESEGTRDEILNFAKWLITDLNPDELDYRGTPEQVDFAVKVLKKLLVIDKL